MTGYLKIRNWEKFQHYKDRNPPWIKLATDTFQNYEFACLHDASKLLALCIWTLASRSKDGSVPADFDYIKRQGNLGSMVQPEHLKELIDHDFIYSDSVLLADCKQNACPEAETETETENKETHSKSAIARLEELNLGGLDEWKLQQEMQGTPITVDMRAELEKFRTHYLAYGGKDKNGNTVHDWTNKFKHWVLQQQQQVKNGQNNGKSRASIGSENRYDASRKPTGVDTFIAAATQILVEQG